MNTATTTNTLKIKEVGIDTYRENIIFMHADCHVCISEGFTALTRIRIIHKDKSIVATLNVVYSDMLATDEAGLSMEAMKRLNVREGDIITLLHLRPITSLSYVRAKMYGKELESAHFDEIITDVVSGHYSNIELAAFISACSGDNLSVNEITGLTKAMINCSERMEWGKGIILDKHCVGGLPGNRTTPIVVSIVAAAGLTIPKTSSRAITSPAGTSDTMEVMTKVDLPIDKIKKVVEQENACITWGGAVKLSPADDILISVERSLDIDSDGQMIASVLSKKVTAGSTHVLIDIPVGPTAKVRSNEQALKLQYYFKAVSAVVGLNVEVIITDGHQPVGRGIGPALEAMDVLSVLRNEKHAPADLRQRSLMIAAALLELSGKFKKGEGMPMAIALLDNGRALKKFMNICNAQGGFTEPEFAKYRYDVLYVLFTVFADAIGELDYVKEYIGTISNLVILE
ncbi:MAG: thymidine phosphorylase family protein [Bacteroidetes bacterium]|nr:thymidine phosphorylase family protein [Bacteroidota bacterium]